MPTQLPGSDDEGDAAADRTAASTADLPIDKLVAQTLRRELRNRGLSTSTNGAWQIFHGILAYGRDFQVETPDGPVQAIEYFASGGTCDGFRPMPGDRLPSDQPDQARRTGLRVAMEPDTKIGQGHRDQWLAVLAQAGLQLDDPWMVGEQRFTIDDWLRQAELDVPLNYEAEFSWTLIPLSLYRPTDYRWTARDGEVWSTELLLESEVRGDLEASVCGGTHRAIGIAYAVRNRLTESAAMTSVWMEAQQHLQNAVELARANQNPDGSFSTAYFHRTGWCSDMGEMLGTTGHVLEFLAIAGDDEIVRADWVQRTARRLCQILDTLQGVDLECGVLYHALHGLARYQERLSA